MKKYRISVTSHSLVQMSLTIKSTAVGRGDIKPLHVRTGRVGQLIYNSLGEEFLFINFNLKFESVLPFQNKTVSSPSSVAFVKPCIFNAIIYSQLEYSFRLGTADGV